jgi:hypothetical protein
MNDKSKYCKIRYAKIKADPVLYAAYLERKRSEDSARVESGKKRIRPRSTQKWRLNNPEAAKAIRQAGHAVQNALLWRKLIKPSACAGCGREGPVEAHHFKGYSREYWLTVMWLCRRCHKAAEKLASDAS